MVCAGADYAVRSNNARTSCERSRTLSEAKTGLIRSLGRLTLLRACSCISSGIGETIGFEPLGRVGSALINNVAYRVFCLPRRDA
jgi:hypothetical protein